MNKDRFGLPVRLTVLDSRHGDSDAERDALAATIASLLSELFAAATGNVGEDEARRLFAEAVDKRAAHRPTGAKTSTIKIKDWQLMSFYRQHWIPGACQGQPYGSLASFAKLMADAYPGEAGASAMAIAGYK